MQLRPYKVLVTEVKSIQRANITDTLRYDL